VHLRLDAAEEESLAAIEGLEQLPPSPELALAKSGMSMRTWEW